MQLWLDDASAWYLAFSDWLDERPLYLSPSLWAALLVAALLLWLARRSRRNYLRLSPLPASGAADLSTAVVIIPARDEAARIQTAVANFPPQRVVVADDHSSDSTASLAAAAGAAVVPAPPLTGLWKGKTNACWAAAQATSARWLLFTSAATTFAPGSLEHLLAYAQGENLMAATVLPAPAFAALSGRAFGPYAFALYFLGVDPAAVNFAKSPRSLGAAECFLVRRDAYDFTGGHKTIARSVIDGMALAQLLKRHRMELRVLRAEAAVSAVMFENFTAVWRFFKRNSLELLKHSPKVAAWAIPAAALSLLWLPVLAGLLLERLYPAAALFAALPSLAWWRWYGGFPRALLAPVALLLFPFLAAAALLSALSGGTTLWKGRPV